MERSRNFIKRHGIFLLALLFCGIFLIWKCPFGLGNVDETFYLTTPFRLYQGDALFVEEWHLSQMAGVITLPLVGSFVAITGSAEGLVLFMRYATVVAQVLIAAFLYIRLWKYNRPGAAIAAISYVLFIPFGIMTLSYNSIAITALILTAVIVCTAQKHRALQYLLAGLCYAAAVLCSPYLAAVFFLYLLGVIVAAGIRKWKPHSPAPEFFLLQSRGALWLSLGAAIAAAAFLIFVLSRASLNEILQALPYIMDDPEHPPITLHTLYRRLLLGLFAVSPLVKYIYPAMLVLFLICLFDKKRDERKVLYFTLATLVCIPLLIVCFRAGINQMMWPLNTLAAFAILLSPKKAPARIFSVLWLLGMCYVVCINMGSNQAFFATSSASAVSLVGSIMLICGFLADLWQNAGHSRLTKPLLMLAALMMLFQLGGQAYLRYHTVFWEPQGMQGHDYQLTQGPNAGLKVSEYSYNLYEGTMKQEQAIAEYAPDKVLHLSFYSWKNLTTDYEMSGYSGWLAGMTEHTVHRLGQYYELNPEKWPDLVCLDLAQRNLAELFCEKYGYRIDYDTDFIILIKAD